jgi:nitronate monooxygenase
LGARFIASHESRANSEYRQMLVASNLDDVITTQAFTGLQTSMLLPSIHAAGLDPARLEEAVTPTEASKLYGAKAEAGGPKRWNEIHSAGHSVSGVDEVLPAGEIVRRMREEYAAARAATTEMD